MTVCPSDNPPWSLVEWGVTGLTTLVASVGAFVWRLLSRLQAIEASLKRQRQDLDQTRQSTELAVSRLAERLEQLIEDYYALREVIGALPSRADLRSLDEHIAERLDALAARLDRMIDA